MTMPKRRIEFGWDGDGGLGDRLVQQIIDGHKTATCGFKAAYTPEELEEAFGNAGELLTASASGGPARCIIRVMDVFETTFGNPDPRLVHGEGDGEDVAKFQADHRIAWHADFPDRELFDDEVLIVELFEFVREVVTPCFEAEN